MAEAEKAMAILRRAVADGYRDIHLMWNVVGLDPLRSRSDSELLMMDLVMPADPWARPEPAP
jgi:hypothetical protein